MNLFRLKEFWRYRRQAKGRHGVHSPAVYCFVEMLLCRDHKPKSHAEVYQTSGGGEWKPTKLLWRIAHYFSFDEVIVVENGEIFYAQKAPPQRSSDLYSRFFDWQGLSPENWQGHLRKMAMHRQEKDVIVLHSIHESPAHVSAWKELCRQPEVSLSIDLFEVGLLFFSKEFKERQHFVLRYSA